MMKSQVMILRLFFYEWFKLGKRRLILLLIVLLYLISCGLYVHTEYNAQQDLISNRAEFELLETELRHLPLEEGSMYVADMVQELEIYDQLSFETFFTELGPEWEEEMNELKEAHPDSVERYAMSHYAHDSEALYVDLLLYKELNQMF